MTSLLSGKPLFNYLAISNVYTRDIFPPIEPITPKFGYFGASNKVMWKVIYIIRLIIDCTILYLNIVQTLVACMFLLLSSLRLMLMMRLSHLQALSEIKLEFKT